MICKAPRFTQISLLTSRSNYQTIHLIFLSHVSHSIQSPATLHSLLPLPEPSICLQSLAYVGGWHHYPHSCLGQKQGHPVNPSVLSISLKFVQLSVSFSPATSSVQSTSGSLLVLHSASCRATQLFFLPFAFPQ